MHEPHTQTRLTYTYMHTRYAPVTHESVCGPAPAVYAAFGALCLPDPFLLAAAPSATHMSWLISSDVAGLSSQHRILSHYLSKNNAMCAVASPIRIMNAYMMDTPMHTHQSRHSGFSILHMALHLSLPDRSVIQSLLQLRVAHSRISDMLAKGIDLLFAEHQTSIHDAYVCACTCTYVCVCHVTRNRFRL